MAYTPTEWKNGDVITAEKLNKIESGIESASSGGGIMIINAVVAKNESSYIVTADKTYENVLAAYNEGKMVVVRGKVDFEGIGEEYQDYWITRDYIMQEAPRPNTTAFTFNIWKDETNTLVNYSFIISTSGWQFRAMQLSIRQ